MNKKAKPTVAELWAKYLELVVPKDAGECQVIATKHAFYAGAWSLFESIMAMLDPGEDPTTADLAKMDALAAELKTWSEAQR